MILMAYLSFNYSAIILMSIHKYHFLHNHINLLRTLNYSKNNLKITFLGTYNDMASIFFSVNLKNLSISLF